MRKYIAVLLTLLLLSVSCTAGAAGIGVSLSTFEELYAKGVQFINDNTGRHLLPHELTRDFDASGNRMYRLDKGALHMEMYLEKMTEQISRLVIVLTAPAHMSHGDAEYNDFSVAGYHSYALLMAMSPEETDAGRYSLVDMVNWGIKQYGGTFDIEVGDYRLHCENANHTATLIFENALLTATPAPETTEPADAEEEISEDEDFIG